MWLGDAVIRDVELSTLQANPTSAMRRRGFGGGSPATVLSSLITAPPFASWEVGVQKLTRRWVWNLGDSVRHIRDRGRSLGVALAPTLAPTMAGSVCVNESSLSARRRQQQRRISQPQERMVYVDWESSGSVGFLVSSTAIHVPRFLKMDRFGQMQPFYTEFSVFQATGGKSGNRSASTLDNTTGGSGLPDLPEVVCSTICRLYGEKRRLHQGVSSFFTLRRFGENDADENEFR